MPLLVSCNWHSISEFVIIEVGCVRVCFRFVTLNTCERSLHGTLGPEASTVRLAVPIVPDTVKLMDLIIS